MPPSLLHADEYVVKMSENGGFGISSEFGMHFDTLAKVLFAVTNYGTGLSGEPSTRGVDNRKCMPNFGKLLGEERTA